MHWSYSSVQKVTPETVTLYIKVNKPVYSPVGSCWDSSSYEHVQVWSPVHGRGPAADPGFSFFRDVTSTFRPRLRWTTTKTNKSQKAVVCYPSITAKSSTFRDKSRLLSVERTVVWINKPPLWLARLQYPVLWLVEASFQYALPVVTVESNG